MAASAAVWALSAAVWGLVGVRLGLVGGGLRLVGRGFQRVHVVGVGGGLGLLLGLLGVGLRSLGLLDGLVGRVLVGLGLLLGLLGVGLRGLGLLELVGGGLLARQRLVGLLLGLLDAGVGGDGLVDLLLGLLDLLVGGVEVGLGLVDAVGGRLLVLQRLVQVRLRVRGALGRGLGVGLCRGIGGGGVLRHGGPRNRGDAHGCGDQGRGGCTHTFAHDVSVSLPGCRPFCLRRLAALSPTPIQRPPKIFEGVRMRCRVGRAHWPII